MDLRRDKKQKLNTIMILARDSENRRYSEYQIL